MGDVNYYFERPRIGDDLHGMGAFILMCTELYKLFDKAKNNGTQNINTTR